MEYFDKPIVFKVRGTKQSRYFESFKHAKNKKVTLFMVAHSSAEVFGRLLHGYKDFVDLEKPLYITKTHVTEASMFEAQYSEVTA